MPPASTTMRMGPSSPAGGRTGAAGGTRLCPVTSQPHAYPDLSNSVTAPVATSARPFTEPMRELGAFALLTGNGVFLALGFGGLFFVIDRWVSDFGLRCAEVFTDFVGPLSLGLPVLA